ncbi:calcium-independent phospholipase A2-gamma-like [Cololabis saira]|uniref:calcium-independent phospholipase A2-gamma-like n=1 Tax=Cololabis saira TaxID=129043 RepID=UPI002AD59F5F|nr:calcium-independent phospholipase A2-gamma-like [Cololabis saira]XP_061577029.1 calcium-independent phospholipase A2-gamma-like [Cololabis saira]XP_061577030.1 calcium-independent phospholipase A2-gamma-like [Cololabis saira]
MNQRWAPDVWGKISRASLMWQTQTRKSTASLSLSVTPHFKNYVQQSNSYNIGYLSLRHFHHLRTRGRKGCKANQVRQRLGLHTSSQYLNTSASRWSAGLSQHMSRVKSTLGTVSKAVSGTHTELLSKISRLKSNALKGRTAGEASAVSTPRAESIPTSSTSAPSSSSPAPKPVLDSSSASPSIATSVATTTALDANATTSTHPHTSAQVTAAVVTVREGQEKKLRRVVPIAKATCARKPGELPSSLNDNESKSTAPKETTALFHPSTFSVSLDETYTYVAHHVNAYFSSSTKAQDKKRDNVESSSTSTQEKQTSNLVPVSDKTKPAAPATTPASKKSFGQYLSYSAPTMQAFVGNYIAPLVPKFRTGETTPAVLEESKSEDMAVKQDEAKLSKEQMAADEKAKKLLLQREKIIARVSVDNRTRALVQALHRASDVRVYINRVEDLSYHLLEFPETRCVAVKEKVIPCLLRLMQADDPGLRAAVREALALVGHHQPVKGRGIRILSIDGGGLRGLLALQTIHRLEALTGKPIYKLFDYICGVSTGAVLGFMLGVLQIPGKDCDDLYRKLGSDVFKQNMIVGTVKMGWSHAFYDSEAWESILKEKMGSHLLVETARNPECPKVAAVSTVVNRGPLKAYVFRNYNLLPGLRSHYLGGCQHQLWQAIRATSAAPGYFQEFSLGNDLHQDGGLLMNNPTALAIHECKCLWPNTPLECVVSLGTGRFETPGKNSARYTSLKTKLTNVISSATDTEEVHAMLDAFLPPDAYFRFNPFISEDISMDESRLEKLGLLQAEGVRYLERNDEKLDKVARLLTREKSSVQRLTEWGRLWLDRHDGLSFKF